MPATLENGRLELTRRQDGWWIEGLAGVERMGPYQTRQEAEADVRGLNWFYRHAAPCEGGERCKCSK